MRVRPRQPLIPNDPPLPKFGATVVLGVMWPPKLGGGRLPVPKFGAVVALEHDVDSEIRGGSTVCGLRAEGGRLTDWRP